MSITAITFEEFLATIEREKDTSPSLSSVPESWDEWGVATAFNSALEYPELYGLGFTVQGEEQIARFDGVRQDLVRELRAGMCTVKQAVAYLKNFELHLRREQDKSPNLHR